MTYIFRILSQKLLLRTLFHLIPELSCQKPWIENSFFKSTKKLIHRFCYLLVIKTWNEKSFVNSQKDKIIFTDFKLFSLFEDMILAFSIMKCFPTLLTFIIPVVYHQNLKLIKLCLISVKLITLFFQYCTKSQSAVSISKPLPWNENWWFYEVHFSTLKLNFNDSS